MKITPSLAHEYPVDFEKLNEIIEDKRFRTGDKIDYLRDLQSYLEEYITELQGENDDE